MMPNLELVDTAARKALRQHLLAMPGMLPEAQLALEGFDYTPKTGTPFLEDLLVADSTQPRSLGVTQLDWSYILTLKYPANRGTQAIETMGGKLRDWFKTGTKLSADGLNLLCYKAARRGSIVTTAGWQTLTVAVTLQAFAAE